MFHNLLIKHHHLNLCFNFLLLFFRFEEIQEKNSFDQNCINKEHDGLDDGLYHYVSIVIIFKLIYFHTNVFILQSLQLGRLLL